MKFIRIISLLLALLIEMFKPAAVRAQNWTQTTAPSALWYSIASSADGNKLAAVVYRGSIYASTNAGSTWLATSAPSNWWTSIASSADGTTLAAAVDGGPTGQGGPIYISNDSGATWAGRSEEHTS